MRPTRTSSSRPRAAYRDARSQAASTASRTSGGGASGRSVSCVGVVMRAPVWAMLPRSAACGARAWGGHPTLPPCARDGARRWPPRGARRRVDAAAAPPHRRVRAPATRGLRRRRAPRRARARRRGRADPLMGATPAQVRAFRLRAHGLATPVAEPAAALACWAVQDSPPGAAALALHARVADLAPGRLDEALRARRVVALYNARTATVLLAAEDVRGYAAAVAPGTEAELRALIGTAVPDDVDAEAAADVAVTAIADALDGTVLSRDELHEALRARLPPALLPWCPRCESHHARRGLLVLAGLQERLCIAGRAGRAGRQPAFARTDQWLGDGARADPDVEGRDLVRRYLRFYGPSSRAAFGEWAGIGREHAARLWD